MRLNTNYNNIIYIQVLFTKTPTIASLVRAPRRRGTPYCTFHQKCEIYTFDHGRPMNQVNMSTSKLYFTLTLIHLFDTQYQRSFFGEDAFAFDIPSNLKDFQCWSDCGASGCTVLSSLCPKKSPTENFT